MDTEARAATTADGRTAHTRTLRRTQRTMRRGRFVAPALLVVVSVLPAATASAAEPGGASTLTATTGGLQLTAKAATNNRVATAAAAGNTIDITDSAGIDLGSPAPQGCSRQSPSTYRCPTPGTLEVSLGDLDDVAWLTTAAPARVNGGDGNDTILTGAGKDVVRGGDGNDTIATGAGRDVIKGGDENDTIDAGAGKDVLAGGDGNDTLNGGPGPDSSDKDSLKGGPGDDTAQFIRRTSWPVADADNVADDGQPGENDNVRSDIEHIDFKPYNFDGDNQVLPGGGSIDVARVWSGSNAAFDLATRRDLQVAAYYDAVDGKITLAARRIGQTNWTTKQLPTDFPKPRTGRRSIRIAFDPTDRLHVAGNMDRDVIQYVRSKDPVLSPEDITKIGKGSRPTPPFTLIDVENKATYPDFMTDADGNFLFSYRHGGSASADVHVYRFDTTTLAWSHANDGMPIFSGREAFANDDERVSFDFTRFEHGDWTHLLVRVRPFDPARCGTDPLLPYLFDSAMCRLAYVKTKNWVDFYNAAGNLMPKPLTFENLKSAQIDAGPGGGQFTAQLAFDADGRPIVAYNRNVGPLTVSPDRQTILGTPEVFIRHWTGTTWAETQLTHWNQPFDARQRPAIRISVTGPVAVDGVQRWLTSASWGEFELETGQQFLDLDPLGTTPVNDKKVPDPSNPCRQGSDRASALLKPVEYPDYEDPKTKVHFRATVRRSDEPHRTGTADPTASGRNDAGDYYYLRWETIDRGAGETDPAAAGDPEPPATKLTLHRTNCAK